MKSLELIKRLPIIDENILETAAGQPRLFILTARYRVQKMRERAEAVAKRDYEVSRLSLRIRSIRDDRGKKTTEGYIKEKVACNEIVRQSQVRVDRAYEREELAKLILEAMRMRRDAIRIIAEGQQAEGIRGGYEVDRAVERRKLVARARQLRERSGREEE